MSWCTVESDPGVFTELIEACGVKGTQVEELVSLEPEEFAQLGNIYGLIFLFKWQSKKPDDPKVTYDMSSDVFFANQVINNACGTQALLHILLNHPDIQLGETLSNFKMFTSALPPDLIGEALGSQDEIRKVHNSFARPEPFVMEKSTSTDEDDAPYHFIAYVPVGGNVYELDGLQQGPVKVGSMASGEHWTQVAREAIQSRIAKYGGDVMFSLMALCENRQDMYAKQVAELQAQAAAMEDGKDDDAKARIGAQIQRLEADIAAEKEKFRKYRVENVRRRHNYIPLAVELLRALAEKDMLMPMLEAGKTKAKAAYEAAQKRRAERKERKAAAAAGSGAGSST